jgi:hypothetical protein
MMVHRTNRITTEKTSTCQIVFLKKKRLFFVPQGPVSPQPDDHSVKHMIQADVLFFFPGSILAEEPFDKPVHSGRNGNFRRIRKDISGLVD